MQRRGGYVIRRWLAVGTVVVATVASALGGVTGVQAGGLQQVNTWATIASTRPGIGCMVDVTVEVRAGGGPVPGIAVQIAFQGDGSTVTSMDEGTTGDDGIAWLAFATGNAVDGANGWLDVNVAGTYVMGTSVLPRADGDCSSGGTLISGQADVAIDTAGTSPGTGVIIGGVPAYKQARSLSCEYASVYIATSVFGDPIAEDEYIWSTPQADNPHFGYRGNIDGPWGITDDYGIYAEALVPLLEARGYVGEVSYGADAGYLEAQIDAGRPTLVWFATRGDTSFYEWDADGNRFKLVPYEHVAVVYGYDEGGVYISDPGPGEYRYYTWGWFLDAWAVLDGMSLAIYPA